MHKIKITTFDLWHEQNTGQCRSRASSSQILEVRCGTFNDASKRKTDLNAGKEFAAQSSSEQPQYRHVSANLDKGARQETGKFPPIILTESQGQNKNAMRANVLDIRKVLAVTDIVCMPSSLWLDGIPPFMTTLWQKGIFSLTNLWSLSRSSIPALVSGPWLPR